MMAPENKVKVRYLSKFKTNLSLFFIDSCQNDYSD